MATGARAIAVPTDGTAEAARQEYEDAHRNVMEILEDQANFRQIDIIVCVSLGIVLLVLSLAFVGLGIGFEILELTVIGFVFLGACIVLFVVNGTHMLMEECSLRREVDRMRAAAERLEGGDLV